MLGALSLERFMTVLRLCGEAHKRTVEDQAEVIRQQWQMSAFVGWQTVTALGRYTGSYQDYLQLMGLSEALT